MYAGSIEPANPEGNLQGTQPPHQTHKKRRPFLYDADTHHTRRSPHVEDGEEDLGHGAILVLLAAAADVENLHGARVGSVCGVVVFGPELLPAADGTYRGTRGSPRPRRSAAGQRERERERREERKHVK